MRGSQDRGPDACRDGLIFYRKDAKAQRFYR
jgi:hypothetical protein